MPSLSNRFREVGASPACQTRVSNVMWLEHRTLWNPHTAHETCLCSHLGPIPRFRLEIAPWSATTALLPTSIWIRACGPHVQHIARSEFLVGLNHNSPVRHRSCQDVRSLQLLSVRGRGVWIGHLVLLVVYIWTAQCRTNALGKTRAGCPRLYLSGEYI